MTGSRGRIGTLGERPLHAALKRWYAVAGDGVEVEVDGYVIDLVRGDRLIEIQTRGFSGMRRKLEALLEHGHHVRVVHPVAVDRWIVKVDTGGAVIDRRRSPRHGTAGDILIELVSFPELIDHPGFEIEVLLTAEEEYRHLTPGRSWRRGGWSTLERRLVEVRGSVVLRAAADVAALLPTDLPDPFTTADLAGRIGRPRRVAQQTVYCLGRLGAITATGRTSRGVEYRVPSRLPTAAGGAPTTRGRRTRIRRAPPAGPRPRPVGCR